MAVFFAVLTVAALVATAFWIATRHPQTAQAQETVEVAAPGILAPADKSLTTPLWLIPPAPSPTSAVPIAAVAGRPLCQTSLAGTQPHVAQVGNFLKMVFGLGDIGGANGRSDGDHGAGLALDLMMTDTNLGTAVANYVLANREALGVTYVIWQQQYNDGGGWSMMEDRGSPTANHYDHVHVSFAPSSDTSLTC